MVFLKTVLIIILVYYALKALVKWFAPRLLSYAAKKTEAHFKEKMGDFSSQNHSQEEQVGDVFMDKKTAPKKRRSKKVGEYIDFEEIE